MLTTTTERPAMPANGSNRRIIDPDPEWWPAMSERLATRRRRRERLVTVAAASVVLCAVAAYLA